MEHLPRIFLYAAALVVPCIVFALFGVIWKSGIQVQSSYEFRLPMVMTTSSRATVEVPFIASIEPDWSILHKSLEAYRLETHHLLEQVSMTLEVVLAEEAAHCPLSGSIPRFSDRLREKIERLSDIYDEDLDTLRNQILAPFPITFALPRAPSDNDVDHDNPVGDPTENTAFTWQSGSHQRDRHQRPLDRPYDSARQVVAHLVRDWSNHTDPTIRALTYGWCVQSLLEYCPTIAHPGPILVPGAGLGRLAWEIASKVGRPVEAIESSVSMAAAANAIFGMVGGKKQGFELHPYAADAFCNEIDSSARYDAIRFPDVHPTLHHGSLSYTIGEFSFPTLRHLRSHYSAIVTCFFVDTATTLYDYLRTIAMVLSPGGMWINLGPLQWHLNSQVPVSADELRSIIEDCCDRMTGKLLFEIEHWSIEARHVDYRNSGRSTRLEAYFPLRFVARRL
jgi:N2227-like protein